MPSSLEGYNREESTDINELLRNLSNLIKVKDKRIAYLASAAVERLASLRAAAANSGFAHWNLLNKTPLTAGSELMLGYRSLMDVLDKLTNALQAAYHWRSLDPKAARAASRIQEAWKALNDHRPL